MPCLECGMIYLPDYKNRQYLNWLKDQPCFLCHRTPSDPAHQNCGFPSGVGMKAPDSFALPLCRECHDKDHSGHYKMWGKFILGDIGNFGIDCFVARICLIYFTRFIAECKK